MDGAQEIKSVVLYEGENGTQPPLSRWFTGHVNVGDARLAEMLLDTSLLHIESVNDGSGPKDATDAGHFTTAFVIRPSLEGLTDVLGAHLQLQVSGLHRALQSGRRARAAKSVAAREAVRNGSPVLVLHAEVRFKRYSTSFGRRYTNHDSLKYHCTLPAELICHIATADANGAGIASPVDLPWILLHQFKVGCCHVWRTTLAPWFHAQRQRFHHLVLATLVDGNLLPDLVAIVLDFLFPRDSAPAALHTPLHASDCTRTQS